MLRVSVSNKVCTIGAHLSCYVLGVLRVGVVVVIGTIAVIVVAGGGHQHRRCCTVAVLTC